MAASSSQGPTIKPSWAEFLAKNGSSNVLRSTSAHDRDLANEPWNPNDEDVAAAWRFLIELRSRVATQTLQFRSGDEAAALDSVYQLFGIFRETASRHTDAFHFAALGLRLLDRHVRPFTAYWHKQKIAGRLSSIDACIEFRAQLASVQTHLRKAISLFSALAKVPYATVAHDADDSWGPNLSLFESDLNVARECHVAASETPWEQIFCDEQQDVLERRKKYGLLADGQQSVQNGIGLALSGGGIRSATFASGVVTVLARQGILKQVDYLSTVSGGGYFGAFISSLLGGTPAIDPELEVLVPETSRANTTSQRSGSAPERTDFMGLREMFGIKNGIDTPALRALRNHSRYLVEGGAHVVTTFIGLMLFGIATSVFLLLPAICVFGMLLKFAEGHAAIKVPIVTSWIAVALVGYVLTETAQRWRSRFLERAGLNMWVCGIGASLVSSLIFTSWAPPTVLAAPAARIGLLIGIAFGITTLARLFGTRIKRLLGLFAVVIGPMMLLVAGYIAAGTLSFDELVCVAAVALVATFFADLNFSSPHRYYRDRLASTYILRPNGQTVTPITPPQKLSQLNSSKFAPYHLINAALNIPGSRNPELRGRRTDFFVFSKYWCGAPASGFHPTKCWEAGDRGLDLGSAVAISGAAAAPNMGTNLASRYRFALALLNIRLNYWLRQPRGRGWLFPLTYFWRELLGHMDETLPYLNLSDGGHIENLGAYELLRRQCKFILVVDGEADPQRTFDSLLTLTQLAHVDLGVRIEPDLGNLRTDSGGIGKSHFELFRISYVTGGQGLMLYIKSSLTGNESEFLKRYQAEHPEFPHESTAQQIYTERQFEAYRALGEHIAVDLFRKDLVGNWDIDRSVAEWLRSLSTHLLVPDSA